MKRPHVMFTGTGRAVPKRIMTNHDFAAIGIETDDAWIVDRTGIRQRHVAGPGESLTSLAAEASKTAMAAAGVNAAEIDAIVMATVSPDHLLPAAAVEVQAAIGASRAAAFDVDAACTGWIYAVVVAEGLIATGNAETVLVIGGEVLTRIVNWKDRNTCVLFGDGVGATIVKRATKGKGLLSSYLRTDGTLAKLLWRPAGGGEMAASDATIADGSFWVHMQGREVFKHAVRSMADACERALDGAKLSADSVDLVIPHQANVRIIEATAKHANISMDKVYVNVDRYGNTSAGSIPIALDECIRSGRITDGSTVMFVGFGAGFTWGSLIVRF
ncbi:MAG: ketoacyl-ACP synthase III [Gemmatimonadetes bacterium]|nr:ketoacyl-ACP synthase III [Gemmatimonadota bacterium]